MMIIIASLAVALVAFIMYALDRRSKGEPIAWESAGKIFTVSGLLTAGVVFATGSEVPAVAEAVKTVAENVDVSAAQEMFVGVPTF